MSGTQTNELKPCPFCGGEAAVCFDAFERICVKCTNCGARSESGVKHMNANERDAANATAKWNRRAVKHGTWKPCGVMLDPQCDTVKCSECGYMVATERGKSGSPYCPQCGAKMGAAKGGINVTQAIITGGARLSPS